jgi:hypothetical protein
MHTPPYETRPRLQKLEQEPSGGIVLSIQRENIYERKHVHLLGDGGALLNVVECPTLVKITQSAKDQQIDRQSLLVVAFPPAPAIEEGISRYPLNKLPEIWIRETKANAKFSCMRELLRR